MVELEIFLQIYKKDLQKIEIDRRTEGKSYRCELIMNYGSYSVNSEFESTGIKKLIVAGGVSANKYLRKELETLSNKLNVDLSIPPLKYCTDNATMIACAAYPQYLKQDFTNFDLNGKSQEYFFLKKD